MHALQHTHTHTHTHRYVFPIGMANWHDWKDKCSYVIFFVALLIIPCALYSWTFTIT
jgi:hypothetical protein